jgi:hypothetical protein
VQHLGVQGSWLLRYAPSLLRSVLHLFYSLLDQLMRLEDQAVVSVKEQDKMKANQGPNQITVFLQSGVTYNVTILYGSSSFKFAFHFG